MKFGKKETTIIGAGLLGLAGLAYLFWPRAAGQQCPPGYIYDSQTKTCVPDTVPRLSVTSNKQTYAAGEMATFSVVHLPSPIMGQPVFVTVDGQHLGDRGTTGSTGTFVFQTAFTTAGQHTLSFQSSGYTASITVGVDAPVQPQFISVRNNPNITGAWAGVIVSVGGTTPYEYTLNIPTSIGDGNHFRNSRVTDGGLVQEQFYFPPGTHTITGTMIDPSNVTHSDSITFDITQNANGTFTLTVTSA